MYLLIVYLYLILSISLMLFGKSIGYRGASILSCLVMGSATILSYILFFEVALNQSFCSVFFWRWISFDLINLDCYFVFDVLSVSMLLIISTVSLCAVAYSVEYMSSDPHIIRFFSYISLFVFFMVFLVTSSNLFQLFVGWEGVGICSYLLINFWYTRISANRSALLAVFINKIGDIFVLISFGIIFSVYKTCDFSILLGLISCCSNVSEYVILFGYLLLVGAVAKSAQLGLHVWLPEAMEGPTPVSSLIHAATMVTAGIFLLVRFSFVLEYNYKLLVLCMFIGSFTAFFASSVGIFLYDIKKIVAYSTCSQLGYMLMSCGFSNYSYTMFHLISHAFFKALLFLTAGYIIHFCGNEQDIRKMGGFLKIFPSGYVFFLIGSISLIGFPFLSGFFSKEMILEAVYSSKIISFYDLSILCQFIACFSLFFSTLYSIRLIIYIFFGQYSGFKYNLVYFHYSSYFILFSLFILSLFSVFFGYFGKDLFIGEGTSFWQNSLFYHEVTGELDVFLNFVEDDLLVFSFLDVIIASFYDLDFFFDGYVNFNVFNMHGNGNSILDCLVSDLCYKKELYDCINTLFNFTQFIDFLYYINIFLFNIDNYFIEELCFDVLIYFIEFFSLNFVKILILLNWLNQNYCIYNEFMDYGYDLMIFKPMMYFSEYNFNMNGFIFFSSLYFLIYCLIYGFFFSRLINIYKLKFYFFFNIVYFLFSKKYVFFNRLFFVVCSYCLFLFKWFICLVSERGFLERYTSYGVVYFIRKCVFKYIHLKTGIIYHYAGFFLFSLFLLFLILC